jgi:hypothetical protein
MEDKQTCNRCSASLSKKSSLSIHQNSKTCKNTYARLQLQQQPPQQPHQVLLPSPQQVPLHMQQALDNTPVLSCIILL